MRLRPLVSRPQTWQGLASGRWGTSDSAAANAARIAGRRAVSSLFAGSSGDGLNERSWSKDITQPLPNTPLKLLRGRSERVRQGAQKLYELSGWSAARVGP